MDIFYKKEEGMGLLEVLLAIAIFSIGIGAVSHLYLNSYVAIQHSNEKNEAVFLAKEGIEAVRSVRNNNFGDLTEVSEYGVEIDVNNNWVLKNTPDLIINKYTRNIDIENIDEETWKIISTVSWQPPRGAEAVVSFEDYLTAWQEPYTINYDLTTTSSEGGSVTTPGEGVFPISNGETTSIVATEELGYVFSQWIGDVDNIDNINSASTTILMDNDYSVTANFVAE